MPTKTTTGPVRLGLDGHGIARRGMERHGWVRRGEVFYREETKQAGNGDAGRGDAGLGDVGLGKASQGEARFFNFNTEAIMRTVKVSELVLDFTLYPRGEVDSQHVGYIREAMKAGVAMPPIVAEKKTLRVVDGFHRTKANIAEYGEGHEIEIIEKTYKNDAELFLDAARYNSAHGANLSRFDRVHCILRAEQLGITVEQIASALSITADAAGQLRANRVGQLRATKASGGNPLSIPLKRTIAHMAGQTLTKGQETANGKLGGMNASFYVNQVVILIENGLLDKSDEKLFERLARLRELLDEVLQAN